MSNENVHCKMIAPKDLLIFLCLRRYMNVKTRESKVSISKISKQTASSPVTVLNCLERLVESGHIEKQKRGRDMVYILRSGIDAYNYAFLDEDISVSEKIKCAIDSTNVNEDNSGAPENEGLLYGYVVKLEEEVCELKRQNEVLLRELNNVLKCITLISGREYEPILFKS